MRVLRREMQGHLRAQTMTHDDGSIMPNFVQQNCEITDPTIKITTITDSGAGTMATQIRRQQIMRGRENSLLNKLAPARMVTREAMQQHDRVTGDDWLRNQRAESIPCSRAQCR